MRSDLLSKLLKEVSRSFYLTMRVLPAAVRPQIGLAYLIARTTDTIADTGVLPVDQRLDALSDLRKRIAGTSSAALNFGALAQNQSLPAEKVLLERVEEGLAILKDCSGSDRQLIRDVLDVITSGQELDLKRFSGANADKIVALKSDAELDDYTFRVAGCVGEFWTKICHAHLFPQVDLNALLPDAIRFGKGLQLVNILRDIPRDLRNGRCYIPEERLAQVGLQPRDLLSSSTEQKFRPLYDRYLRSAEEHLQAGWNYTCRLPRAQVRVRLACAWPILIGVRTLDKLRHENVLDPKTTVKISRSDVKKIMVQSVLRYPLKTSWENLFPKGNPRPD
jgi:farnesyl-diphosphate farnesyltransferase